MTQKPSFSGVPDKAQRDVTENARTLKFKTAEFE